MRGPDGPGAGDPVIRGWVGAAADPLAPFTIVLTGACYSGGGGVTCDGDVNCDGNLDGFDVQAMESAVGGDNSDFCQADADFNHDGNLDGFDVQAVEAVVGGAPCP